MYLSERLVSSDGVREGDQVCGRGICMYLSERLVLSDGVREGVCIIGGGI